MSQDGIEEAVIKRRLKKIDEAFKNPDRAQASQDLNDIFKGKK